MKIQALLLVAVDCNRPSCIKVLIDDGADPDGATNVMTPLTIAASRGYLACMQTLCLRLLLSSVNTDSPVLRAECLEAARRGRHPQCVQLLVACTRFGPRAALMPIFTTMPQLPPMQSKPTMLQKPPLSPKPPTQSMSPMLPMPPRPPAARCAQGAVWGERSGQDPVRELGDTSLLPRPARPSTPGPVFAHSYAGCIHQLGGMQPREWAVLHQLLPCGHICTCPHSRLLPSACPMCLPRCLLAPAPTNMALTGWLSSKRFHG
ncbi:hypothetical protein B484DRAFT_409053 [Ochromonadaceae sp. CCMP2298]|nr:hypothetical protein B484DRAFT_409053 [Ochromonadaceae sp. CCMP2298]